MLHVRLPDPVHLLLAVNVLLAVSEGVRLQEAVARCEHDCDTVRLVVPLTVSPCDPTFVHVSVAESVALQVTMMLQDAGLVPAVETVGDMDGVSDSAAVRLCEIDLLDDM